MTLNGRNWINNYSFQACASIQHRLFFSLQLENKKRPEIMSIIICFSFFTFAAYQNQTEKIAEGFRVLPFVLGHGGNAETR